MLHLKAFTVAPSNDLAVQEERICSNPQACACSVKAISSITVGRLRLDAARDRVTALGAASQPYSDNGPHSGAERCLSHTVQGGCERQQERLTPKSAAARSCADVLCGTRPYRHTCLAVDRLPTNRRMAAASSSSSVSSMLPAPSSTSSLCTHAAGTLSDSKR